MTRTILVIGATGMLGRPVATKLHAAGYHVRLLARDPARTRTQFGDAYEVVPGDVTHPDTLAPALAGCDGVHINLAGGPHPADYDRVEHRGTAAVARAAADAGVAQITYLSGTSVSPDTVWFYQTAAKYRAEAAIRASGVPFTIFRASWMMESLPLFVRNRRATLIGRQTARLHWVAAADYAQMVVQAYQTPDARGTTLYVYGPEALTMPEALTRYSTLTDRSLTITQLPVWLASLLARTTNDPKLLDTARLLDYYTRFVETGSPTEAHALLGAPTTTLAQWCEQQMHKTPMDARSPADVVARRA